MKIIIKYFLSFWLVLSFFQLNAQNIDSLYQYVIKNSNDSMLAHNLVELAWKARLSNPEKGLTIAKEAIEIAIQIKNAVGMCKAYSIKAGIYKDLAQFDESLKAYFKSLQISEQLIKNDSSNNFLDLKSTALTNIGEIYIELRDFKMAKKYLIKAQKQDSLTNNITGLSIVYNDLGNLAFYEGEINEALNYYKQYLTIQEAIGNIKDILVAKNNIGFTYEYIGQFNEALIFYKQANKLSYEYGSDNFIAATLTNIGSVYGKLNLEKECKKYLEEALIVAKKMNSSARIGDVYETYYIFYKDKKDFKKALEYHIKMVKEKDNILNEKRNELVADMEAKYQTEKKDHKIKMLNTEKEKDAAITIAEQKKKNSIIISIAFGFGLTLIFFVFLFNRYKITQKQKTTIEKQKSILDTAHHELQEKSKEITDSINYAKRIQEAILPSAQLLKQSLRNGFVLYQPKAIVSGDFYWMEIYQDTIYFAAADCTGHGVPGAMVSVVCSNALSKSILEENKTLPGEVLDKTREIVVKRFSKNNEDVKDGMDISLCSLKLSKSSKLSESYATLQWAGANNPLWLIRPTVNGRETKQSLQNEQIASLPVVARNDEYEIIEYKPNKQPIGKTDNPQPFTTHTIELQKDDTIYIFTDGFADQFGGEKGKKLMYKPFKNLLLSIQDKTMDEQKVMLEQHFEEWKGSLEQVDDVCVIGVRV